MITLFLLDDLLADHRVGCQPDVVELLISFQLLLLSLPSLLASHFLFLVLDKLLFHGGDTLDVIIWELLGRFVHGGKFLERVWGGSMIIKSKSNEFY